MHDKITQIKRIPLKQYALSAAILWTLIITLFLLGFRKLEKESMHERALIYTKVGFDKDVLYRQWIAMHGGVYVPVTDKTPPNPYLSHIKNRDVTTESGEKLTLINPAYATRQVYEYQAKLTKVKGHITSLNPIRPENKPDKWEIEALNAFEKGQKEVTAFAEIDGEEYFRYMEPLITQKSCMKCHAAQGYKVGDIRGGISVSYPMKPLKSIYKKENTERATMFGLIWIVGLSVIFIAYRNMKNSDNKLMKAELELAESNQNLEIKVEKRTNELLQSRKDWEHIFNSFGQPAQITSPDFEIIHVNEATLKYLNCSRDSLIGKKCYEVFHNSDHPHKNCPLVKSKNSGVFAESEVDNWLDNEEFIVSCTPFYDENNQIKEFSHILTDLSERKQIEKELKNHKENLEELVKERTNELSKMVLRLQEMDQLKSIFLASMSHELRTPLNSIIGYTGILLMKMAGDLNDEQTDQLSRVKRNARHLLDLINDILDISKIEADRVQLEIKETDYVKIIDDVVDTLKPTAENKNLKMNVNAPAELMVSTDQRRLTQIVMNLVSNAVKYTEKGGVEIELQENQNKTILSVKDTGIGLSDADIKKLFQPFQQIESDLTKKTEGTGLGLYLSSKLSELLGGEITVKSEPNTGSEFVFTLPVIKNKVID